MIVEDNVYKRLRLEKTKKTVMRGEGKTIPVEKPFSQTELAEQLHISQSTLDKAENGELPSLSTVTAYHDFFHVPYSTLLGETDTYDSDNLHLNKELGLSDDCIATIKNLPPISLAMLNCFLGKKEYTELFFYNLADIIYSMSIQLTQNGNDSGESGYLRLRQHAEQLLIDYVKTLTDKDLKKVLTQLDQQQQAIDSINYLNEPFTD